MILKSLAIGDDHALRGCQSIKEETKGWSSSCNHQSFLPGCAKCPPCGCQSKQSQGDLPVIGPGREEAKGGIGSPIWVEKKPRLMDLP